MQFGHAVFEQEAPVGPFRLNERGSYRTVCTEPATSASIRLDHTALVTRGIFALDKQHPATRAVDRLRTSLLQQLTSRGWHSLMVTGPSAGSGASLLAANLAISVAQNRNHTALLVDCNLRRPGLAPRFGVTVEAGIGEVVTGECELSDVLLRTSLDRLSLVPARDRRSDSAELLTAPPARQILTEMAHRYGDRVMIVDTPPLLEADDVLALLPLFDGILLVVGDGQTTRRELEESLQMLPRDRLLGVVQTQLRKRGSCFR